VIAEAIQSQKKKIEQVKALIAEI